MTVKPYHQLQARRFRRWLIERIADTSWLWLSKATNKELAEMLGVHVDVLVDARRFMDSIEKARTEETGLTRARIGMGGRPKTVDYVRNIAVLTPINVFEDWQKVIEFRGTSTRTILRSLTHYFLLHPEYKSPREGWIYKGHRLYCSRIPMEQWPWRLTCKVPNTIRELLLKRSRAMRVPMSTVFRNLVLDYMEDKIQGLEMVTSMEQLWEASRYPSVGEDVVEAARLKMNKRNKKRLLTREELDREDRRAGRRGG